MTGESASRTHFICLSAVFMLGSAVITAPYREYREFAVLGYLLAVLTSVAAYFLLSPVISFLFDERRISTSKRKSAFFAVYLVTALLVLVDAVFCFHDFCDFADKNMLEKTPIIAITVVFAVCCAYSSLFKENALLKFSLFSFVLILIVAVLFFLLLAPRFELDYLLPKGDFSAKKLLLGAKPYLLYTFLPALPVLVYEKLTFPEKKSDGIKGLVIGSVLLFITILCGVLLFGEKQASDMSYAYADAISTVSVGYFFTRMDGFAYFVFFASALIKTGVCINIICKLLNRYNIRRRKTAAISCAVLIFILSFCVGC